MLVRLQKHIADLGYCSRRKAEVYIQEGKVKVNGNIVTTLGTKVDPEKDKVTVQTKKTPQSFGKKVYIAFHKPTDVITSATSSQGTSVMDFLQVENQIGRKNIPLTERVYPVGRLDKDSEGLILLTNDGELANKLTHPRYEHQKEYEVTIGKALSRDAKKVLENGMDIEDGFVQGIKIKREQKIGRRIIITVILKEGKNRQIRKMFGTLGYDVLVLKRTRIHKLKLGTLPIGKWKFVKKTDIV